MDTVIGNKYIDVFSNLNIEVSKKLEGEYSVEEIISTFENFFFNRMFLDITSIKDYKNLSTLQKLSMSLNVDKIIILLDKEDSISDSKVFLSKLVSMGIYNFTKDSNNLMYLYNNPNSYKDVAYLQEINNTSDSEVSVDNSSPELPNTQIILGIKNVTDSAGSTTLTYLLKNVLSSYYSTMALELDKNELTYFNDKDCITVREDNINSIIRKYPSVQFFILDLGKSNKEHLCNEVLYLVEPSTIKLNKLMLINPNIFKELSGKKIVLNKIILSEKDISNFEVEADIRVYYNLGTLNDKEDCSKYLLPLLEKLGYVKNISTEEESNISNKKSIFNLFRK